MLRDPGSTRRPCRLAGHTGAVTTTPPARAAVARGSGGGGRNHVADLLRVVAIGAVVLGHWLLTDVTTDGGSLVGRDALDYVRWGRWLTLLFQVMPVFFVVGGYANAASWRRHRDGGGDWGGWVRLRGQRLLLPTTVYVVVAAAFAVLAVDAGADPVTVSQAGWSVALHLWFLPTYLMLITATPALHAAHRRFGAAVPVALAVAAGAVDVAVLVPRMPLVGFANYLLVWGAMHQWGFAWQDGTLTASRRRPWLLAGAGLAGYLALVGWGPFPVDMIGAGDRGVGNTSPPSVALLAFAAAQTGLLVAVAPALERWLRRRRWRGAVSRLTPHVINVYLWHMAPVLLVAVAGFGTGLLPQPAIGSAAWWGWRPVWLVLLAAVLAPLVVAVGWAERPLARLPAGLGREGPWSAPLLLLGITATMIALARLAIAGFAPAGRLPWLVWLLYLAGVAAVLGSGGGSRSRGAASPGRTAVASQQRPGRPGT